MSLKLRSESQFKILLESLWTELLYANTHFLIFSELRENGKRYLNEINFAPAFWQFTFHGHAELTRSWACSETADKKVGALG